MITHYSIQEITPYINWLYFFHAWDMNGKPKEAKQALRADAEALLKEWEGHYFTHATFDLLPTYAYSCCANKKRNMMAHPTFR